MEVMFSGGRAFNQDISAWDTGGVKHMEKTFYGASNFSQRLCWDLGGIPDLQSPRFAGLTDGSAGGQVLDKFCADCPCDPSLSPTHVPIRRPTLVPTKLPSVEPSAQPTAAPNEGAEHETELGTVL